MVRSTIFSMVLTTALTILGCYELPGEPDWVEPDMDLANKAGSQSVVGLASYDDYMAGGTGVLITPTLVLTAGHCGTSECSDMSIQRHYTVRVGQDSKHPIEEIKVIAEIEHPDLGRGNPSIGTDHCGGGWGIDLGIWVLEHPPQYAKPISGFGSVDVGDAVVMFGYGPYKTDSEDDYGDLKVKFGKVDRIELNMNQGSPPFSNGGVRLFSEDIKSVKGDSGGPYFNTEGELVGINAGHKTVKYTNGYVIEHAIGQVIEPYLGWIFAVAEEYRE